MTESLGHSDEPTYEQKLAELARILQSLETSETPIDKLSEDVKRGATLIKELNQRLKQVEAEVKDAFRELGDLSSDPAVEESRDNFVDAPF
ncbi:exodeoxyribonuclease VII small subunit [Cyanobium sp. N5-Cardenillas]|uniref:exodeoxyribonuclease VII small subunit n=1 Tax=Cyanobium sp. N5-Cardenillas TaxID=2823720 RepID=UPI0020CFB949|nr:exodeoxyribonuclease VII small subunit [Cyanobium sp. N5-Cardenillas]MCP9786771.1 exodeoxyribonuclease VII small subunit [Cyanobium sp. N5-Cardenillas]